MWELRHRIVLGEVLERLPADGISALLLKGSAIAYDLYDSPAIRERGDTDLLVAKGSREAARKVLADCEFARSLEGQDLPDTLRSQEVWTLTSDDGTSHSIDLHWQPLNAPALDRQLSFGEMTRSARALPRLSEAAKAPSRTVMLLHACLHRGLHECAPYFVGGETYYGGNRLIWLYDLVLLGRAMTDADWRDFCQMAVDKRVADICVEGLSAAESRLGRFCPPFVHEELGSAKSGFYFRSGQFGRALRDMFAVPGVQPKWQYLWARSVPTREFMRAKYPEMASRSLPALYMRRVLELVRKRPGQGT
jgi:putative nucleotidyltransferase-like protein